jgi:phenylalanine--tRNA ligase, alpha subunit
MQLQKKLGEVLMKEKLEELRQRALEKIKSIEELDALNELRIAYLGKKGELTQILKAMKDVSDEERPKIGQMVNQTREIIEENLNQVKDKLNKRIRDEKIASETIDVTLPAKTVSLGHLHPNTIALEEIEKIFIAMGYEVVEGPEIEYDEYNFTKLNIPANHPAKDEQDTFYINKDIVLRTQTSPVQARVMETGKVPIRMISPGRVFRSDEVDATHSPSFHQVEGLVIDKNITFSDLKGTLAEFAKRLFGEDTKVKFRPHHFPFTEPSAEMDVSCFKCKGKGCRMCKSSGWIEILGCGMVHPHVFDMCGVDKSVYQGFAFGVGLERIALLKYEIDDMRLLYENDIRFLKQF